METLIKIIKTEKELIHVIRTIDGGIKNEVKVR